MSLVFAVLQLLVQIQTLWINVTFAFLRHTLATKTFSLECWCNVHIIWTPVNHSCTSCTQTSSYLAFYLYILTSTVNFQRCTDLLTKVLCTNTYKSWLRSKAETTTSWSLSSCSNHYDTITMGWHGGATVGRRTCNQEVASSIHRQAWLRNDSGQVVHTQLP